MKAFCMKLGNLTMNCDFLFKENTNIAIFYKHELQIKNGKESFFLEAVNCSNIFSNVVFDKEIDSSIIKLPIPNITNLSAIVLCSVRDYILDTGFITIEATNCKLVQECRDIVHSSEHKRITNLHELSDCFNNVFKEKLLHVILEDLFDGGYHCSSFSSNTLIKDCLTEPLLHCDYPYHNLEIFPKNTILGVQCNLTLDKFTIENGATKYKKNSHKKYHNPIYPNEYLDGVFTADTGTFIIYLATLWHTESINTTENRRSAILSNYVPLYIPPKDDSGKNTFIPSLRFK